jgi:FKBP-type peptidyl-prolyl cis-trans isomerase FklB
MNKKHIAFFLAILINLTSMNAQKLKTEIDSVSYCIGVNIGENLKNQFSDINIKDFMNGINDVLDKKSESKISNAEAQKILQEYFTKQQEMKTKLAKEEGANFLAENAKKEGVISLESGLQYEILKQGSGAKPTINDNVTTHYHGTLIDGTIFDSSVDRGQPATFPVNGVIKGWTEALQLMSVGSKWRLYIPYDLAYGERGAGANIGPFTTLIFEVELISIN